MAIAEDYNFESLNIISGNLEVRLAENSLEIDAAQALRYKVFYEEMHAIPSTKQKKSNLYSTIISSEKTHVSPPAPGCHSGHFFRLIALTLIYLAETFKLLLSHSTLFEAPPLFPSAI